MPPLDEPFLIFVRKLNELGIRYMVSGSVAATFYGEPRMTNDVDIVVFLQRSDIPRLELAFPEEEFYRPPAEVMELELARAQRGHFNLIHHATGLKADIYLCGDPLHRWGISRVQTVDLGEDRITLAPPEYVILRKLQFFKEGGAAKHLRDVSRMLAATGESWEAGLLATMLRDYHLEQEWQQVLALMEKDQF